MKQALLVIASWVLSFVLVGCNRSEYDGMYEVIERSEQELPTFRGPSTSTEVRYVLLHNGHKFHATCDFAQFKRFDQGATCRFRIFGKYKCELGADKIWDLKCKDSDGNNVYLFVNKKE